jgi:hypothetical protein
MLNFIQGLFNKRPPEQSDAGEVSRLKQMRERSTNASESGAERVPAQSEKTSRSVSGTLSKGPTAVDVTNKVVVGRGSVDQSQEVQQKWIDECGFTRPNTGIKS